MDGPASENPAFSSFKIPGVKKGGSVDLGKLKDEVEWFCSVKYILGKMSPLFNKFN